MLTTSSFAAGWQENPVLQIKRVGERVREIYTPHYMAGTNARVKIPTFFSISD